MNLPEFKVRYLRKLLNYPLGGLTIDPEEARKGLEYLGPKKRSEKAKAWGRAARAEDTKKIAAHRMSTKEIRAAVMERAQGKCEACFCPPPNGNALHLDHWLSGSGRRRQRQSVETTWMLCHYCHNQRSLNWPAPADWNHHFEMHCRKYGYRFYAHIEHKPLPRRGTA